MTVSGVAAPIDLAMPVEPVELREQLRSALLGGSDWESRFGCELGLGEVLWSEWGVGLSAAGLTRERFAAVIRDYRRELWFWVLGDRVWPQVVASLAGRMIRRA